MRNISLATGVLGFSLLISAALVSVQGPSFVADLSGAEEAPPIDTGGSGLASVLLNPGSTALTFEVMAANIRDVYRFAHSLWPCRARMAQLASPLVKAL